MPVGTEKNSLLGAAGVGGLSEIEISRELARFDTEYHIL